MNIGKIIDQVLSGAADLIFMGCMFGSVGILVWVAGMVIGVRQDNRKEQPEQWESLS